jgi:hypothetical protein
MTKSAQVFYQTKLVRAPTGNERGRLTLHYIIAVQTHDPNGNPYEGRPEDRAREAFNLLPGRGVDDPVNLTDIKEEDLPKEKLEQVLLRHDGAVYLVKNECGLNRCRITPQHHETQSLSPAHRDKPRRHHRILSIDRLSPGPICQSVFGRLFGSAIQ